MPWAFHSSDPSAQWISRASTVLATERARSKDLDNQLGRADDRAFARQYALRLVKAGTWREPGNGSRQVASRPRQRLVRGRYAGTGSSGSAWSTTASTSCQARRMAS